MRNCVCKHCGVKFQSNDRRLYCDAHRAEAMAARGGKGRKWPVTTKIKAECSQCNQTFEYYPSQNKKFCSYDCHIASGGAYRAGNAAAIARTMKYGAKKDANHKEIVGAFNALGAAIIDMSNLGQGAPDLVVWCQNGWHLVDIKNPKTAYGRRGLNPRQKDWAADWKGGPVYLISTVEEAANLVNGRLDGLKRFPEAVEQAIMAVTN